MICLLTGFPYKKMSLEVLALPKLDALELSPEPALPKDQPVPDDGQPRLLPKLDAAEPSLPKLDAIEPSLPKVDATEPSLPKDLPIPEDGQSRIPPPNRPLPTFDAAEQFPASKPSNTAIKHGKSISFAPPAPNSSTKPNRKATAGSTGSIEQPKPPSPSTKPNRHSSFGALMTEIPEFTAPSPLDNRIEKNPVETDQHHDPQPPSEARPHTGTKSRVMSFLKTGSFAIVKKPESELLAPGEEKKKNRLSFFPGPDPASEDLKPVEEKKKNRLSFFPGSDPENSEKKPVEDKKKNRLSFFPGPDPASSEDSEKKHVEEKKKNRLSIFPKREKPQFEPQQSLEKNIETLQSQMKIMTRLVMGLVKENRDLRARIGFGGEQVKMSKSLEALVNEGFQKAIEELNGIDHVGLVQNAMVPVQSTVVPIQNAIVPLPVVPETTDTI
jgi:hypothetical protein